jgi:CheY-like chemotaxis protein
MGGQISVHSSPGTGASFRVCLPPADTAGPGARSGQRSGAEPADRAHIVVVDDETLVARLLRRILEGTHHVEVFTSPRLALGYLRSTEDCDLILCDIAMPEFTGPALYRALESVRPELAERMVFMTGATMQPETHAFLASRGRPWLEKPFTGEEVLAMVTRMREARRGAPRRGAVHGEPQPAAPSQ